MDKTQPHPLFKLATELGPLIVFFVANAKFNLFAATGAFMVAIVAAMIASYMVTQHIPMMALVTGVIVLVFGTLTLVLHDETFIKMKPTIVYSLFAAVLGGGLLFGRSFIAIMFDQMFNLTAQGWRVLTFRWALFFLAMAVLNEIIWRTQTTDFWVGVQGVRRDAADDGLCHQPDAADQALSSGTGVAGGKRGRSRRYQQGLGCAGTGQGGGRLTNLEDARLPPPAALVSVDGQRKATEQGSAGFRVPARNLRWLAAQEPAFSAFSISTLRTRSTFSGVTGPTSL